MPEPIPPSIQQFCEGLELAAVLASRACIVAKEAAERGETEHAVRLIDDVIAAMRCDPQQLHTLWITLEVVLFSVRQAAAQAGYDLPAASGEDPAARLLNIKAAQRSRNPYDTQPLRHVDPDEPQRLVDADNRAPAPDDA